jgi:ribonucleoside-diphosphate reductase alpha chain
MAMIRNSLPNRRSSINLAFTHGRMQYHGSASFHSDGSVGEVFLSAGKPGSEVEAVARDCAVMVSLALQHGTPIDVMRRAVTRLDDGTAAGPMGVLLDHLAEGLGR